MVKFTGLLILSMCIVTIWCGRCLAETPTEEIKVKGGQPVFVACNRDGAELRDKPESSAQVIKTIPWMTDFVVIKRFIDPDQREWIRVGDLKTMKEAVTHGWMLKDDLLMRMEALKEQGIYSKAIVVTHYNKATKELGGAPLRYTPLMNAPRVGQELTLYHIFHVYDEREDVEGKETFVLIGNEAAVSDYTKPENTIIGWAPMSKLFLWNTREAAEYDKATIDKRGAVRIYEKLEDLRDVIKGIKKPDEVDILAREDVHKKELSTEDFRFPIISKEETINGIEVWKIAFSGGAAKPIQPPMTHPPVLDVLFVCDGTGCMQYQYFRDAINSVVQNVQNKAIDYWTTNWKGEKPPIIRFSIAMYKDYTAKDSYKRVSFDKDNQDNVTEFLNRYEFAGGKEQPAVFHGLSQAIKDAIPEFDKTSFRLVFLIGDMGNMGVSDEKDPKGYKVDDVAKLLKENNCDFYAIHLAGEKMPPAYKKFESETKAIINQLPEGTAKYVSSMDPQQIKGEINKVIFELLDQQFRVIQVMMDIGCQLKPLRDIAQSGTLLERRVLDLLEQHGMDTNKENAWRSTPSVFGVGYVPVTEPGTGIRMMRTVINVRSEDVESLIALLGGLSNISTDCEKAKTVWREVLELATHDVVDDQTVPADLIKKQMGIPVRENILQVPLSDLCKYQDKLQEAIREFKKNLFLLRGVALEKEVTIKEDAHGNLTFELGKDKRWFTGTRGNEWTWLDMEEYIP